MADTVTNFHTFLSLTLHFDKIWSIVICLINPMKNTYISTTGTNSRVTIVAEKPQTLPSVIMAREHSVRIVVNRRFWPSDDVRA